MTDKLDPVESESVVKPAKHYSKQERYDETRNVTLTGIVVNVLLSVAQLVGGVVASSQALIADGFHTLSDLASDFVVLFAAKLASKDADDDHPYGHERIETVATVILGLALAGVAVGIAMNAVERLMHPENLLQPTLLAVVFALFAIVAKEGLYQYTTYIAEKIDSNLLRANAWHHRSDAMSSLMVAVGVSTSVFFQVPWLDAIAAILVAVMIFYMGARLILDSTMELVDTSVDLDKVAKIKVFISELEGVESLHLLRTRKMGSKVLADVHIQVNSFLSVSEGHYIAENVITKTAKAFPEMTDITVHIDPEDDEACSLCTELPSRNQLMGELYPHLQESGLTKCIENIALHYIGGKVDVEIYLASEATEEQTTVLVNGCQKCNVVGDVFVYQKIV